MLDLLLNHSPIFLVGELMLALSLGLFGVALAATVRERYSIRIRWLGPRVVPGQKTYERSSRTPARA
jgi:hypothetical protein